MYIVFDVSFLAQLLCRHHPHDSWILNRWTLGYKSTPYTPLFLHLFNVKHKTILKTITQELAVKGFVLSDNLIGYHV
jgi:hypothetical protein